MPWQTQVAIQLLAGDTIINAAGNFTYSGAPAAGNLSASQAPLPGVDQFGNHYLAGVVSYGSTDATQLVSGFISFYTGSLAGGWVLKATQEFTSVGVVFFSGGLLSGNNTLDDGAGNAAIVGALTVSGNLGISTINGSAHTQNGSNGGVTSGPSGTVNAFPAAGPNHTHAEIHNHPY